MIPRESIASPAAGPQPDRVLTNIRFPDEEIFKIVSLKIFVNRSLMGPELCAVGSTYLYLPELVSTLTNCKSLMSLETVA